LQQSSPKLTIFALRRGVFGTEIITGLSKPRIKVPPRQD